MTPTSSCVPWDMTHIRRLCLSEARRVLNADPALAEDAAQEALIRIWRSAGACASPEAPQPWMRSIARREALRLFARQRERPRETVGQELVSPANGDGDQLLIRQAVGRLQEPDRIVLFMRYWRDLTHLQIAEMLGMPEGTAKVRLHRARKALQRELDDTA
jgi:RNA polymerase sigma-70 factor, ECF subfamily